MRNVKALAQERDKKNICKRSKCDIEEKRHGEGIEAQEDNIVFII
jgi:hypothetical protein